jgi:predicted nucleotide-binding protein
MARPQNPSTPQVKILTPEQMRQGIARLTKRVEEVRAFDPATVVEQYNNPQIDALSAAIDDSLVRTFGAGTVDYDRYRRAAEFDNGPHNYVHRVPIEQVRQSLARSRGQSIALLEQSVKGLEEQLAEQSGPNLMAAPSASPDKSSAFIVHGHDEGAKEAVARFLDRLHIKPIILHEQANGGRTVIEKIEAHGNVGFAIVLLTPDDEGCAKGQAPQPRARQNVILELGYFIARLRRTHVCALKRGEVEIPSDFGGVVYEAYDAGGGWKQALGRELEAVGYQIDWNIVMRS